ncbi:segregation/condensation protein A [Archaeoglobales archaeon]|nr:MAG: segregation/condensation protein A [Archaeoglobales archaeon]
MVKKGEISPWNVDVVELADKFLKKLEEAQQLDLRVSGRVLLYAAILVRMKAEIITAESLGYGEEEEELIPDEVDFSVLEIDEFEEDKEEIIEALITPRKKVKRFTPLKDLIKELKRAEEVEKRRVRRKRREARQEKDFDKTLKIPHEESMEETIAMVENVLKKLFKRKDVLYFSEIVKGMKINEIVSYYLSILHLAYRRKVEVYQEELYKDIEIRGYR